MRLQNRAIRAATPPTNGRWQGTAGFYCLAFRLGGTCCAERPGAVQGAPPGAAKRTLDGEDRSARMGKEGKPEVHRHRSISETWASQMGRAERVSTMVLSEAQGL